MTLSAYNIALNAVVAPVSGTIARGYAATMKADATGYVVADAANLAAGDGVIYGILLADGYAGQFVPICNVGLVDAAYVGAISGSGDYVDVTSTGALVRASSVTVGQTIGHYLATNGDVQVDLALQFSPSVASISDGYVDIATYGSTHAAITAADAVAQASSPPKTLLLRTAITLGASVSVESPMVVRGGSITGAYTMTIEHSVNAPRVQFVTGSAALAWADKHRQDELYPEWWGADPTGHACSGADIGGSVCLANGGTTVGGSGFDSTRDTGKICVVFEQTGLSAHRSTVASVTSSSRLELAAASSADINTTLLSGGGQVWIGTDSYTALRAAIVASRGEIYVSLTPDGEYGVATQLDPRPSAGGLKMRGNRAWIRWCGTVGTHKVFSSDDGIASNGGRSGCDVRDVTISGCMIANDCIYMACESSPTDSKGMSGTWHEVNAKHFQRHGHYHHAAQVSYFYNCQSQFGGGAANTLISCNGSTWFGGRGSNIYGANADSMTIDSSAGGSSVGGGDVTLINYVSEVVDGRGIVVNDSATATGSGSTVAIYGGHLEGCGEDGIHINRRGTVVDGVSISGTAGYYPFRITTSGDGSTVRHIHPSSFDTDKLGGILETGVTHCVIEGAYNPSTGGNRYDPTVTDGWAGKVQIRRSNGDIHAQGKVFVGTGNPLSGASAPTHSLEVESGSLRLGKGHLLLDVGSVSSQFGGIGLGVNGLVQSESFGTTWTATSCTVTSDAVAGPFGSGTLADQLTLTAGSGYVRQYVTDTTMGGLTVEGSTFIFSVWVRAVSGTVSNLRLALVNQAALLEVNGNTFADWTVDTSWKRVYVAWTSTSSATPDAIRCIISSNSGTWDIYAWGAQLEYYSAGYGIEQRHPGPYAKTVATARSVASNGPVFNAPPVVPGGTFTCGAAATTTVNDARVTATSHILLMPTNAAAGTLMGAATSLYVSARTAGVSFAVTTASGGAAAGTETFEYILAERWAL